MAMDNVRPVPSAVAVPEVPGTREHFTCSYCGSAVNALYRFVRRQGHRAVEAISCHGCAGRAIGDLDFYPAFAQEAPGSDSLIWQLVTAQGRVRG